MTAPKLVLHPLAAVTDLPPAACAEVLRELGLIGTAFALDGRTHYRTGPGFLDHVSFLGCAPSIELDPPAAGADAAARAGRFCHIQLPEAGGRARLRLRPGQRPRCRACRHDIDPLMITGPNGVASVCPGCGAGIDAARLNWRQAGGYAAQFLDIWGIHTAEAVPGDHLLDRLACLSGCAWGFFYIED